MQSSADRAQAACAQGGTPPGSAGYPECFQRLLPAYEQARAIRQSTPIQPLFQPQPNPYQGIQPLGGATVTCTTPPTYGNPYMARTTTCR